MSFNPDAPTMFGVEWPVTRQGGSLLAPDRAAAASFSSSVTETINSIWLHLTQVVSGQICSVKVLPSTSMPQTIATDTFRPNEDGTKTSVTDESGLTTNIYQSIDEATLDDTDYIQTASASSAYSFRIASAGGLTPTSPGSITVRLKVVYRVDFVATSSLGAGLNIGGTSYTHSYKSISGFQGVAEWEWTTNPATGVAWTEADIQAFDATDEIELSAGHSNTFRVLQAWVEVDSATTPAAEGTITPTEDGWVECVLDSSWSKVSGTDYSIVVAATAETGQAVWPALDSGEACPHASWVSSTPTVTASGLVTSAGTSGTPAHPVVLETSAAATSADSQPYATLTKEPVYSGRTVQQEFTSNVNVTIGNIAAMIARQGATVDGDLTAAVYRRSDDVQIGGTVTITSDDVATSVRQLRQVVGAMASTGTVTTAQYYVEWTSSATAGAGWVVGVLDSDGSGGTAGFGSTTNAATVGGTEDTSADVSGWVAQVPATIASVAATESGSGASTHVAVSWTASVDASFDHYQILRGGELIATVSTKATVSFADYEARVGTQESYVVRQVLTDGRVSADSTAATVTVADSTTRLTSNEIPALAMELPIVPPMTRSRHRDRAEFVPLGADMIRVHRGAQDRGFEFELVVEATSAGDDAADLFASLVSACEADVDHLCIVTGWGDRCFVTADYTGDSIDVLGFGRATVRFRQVVPAALES